MNSTSRGALVLLCFFLSGFAALLYQIAWTRQFAFVFGTSELAIATVLAAYMAGLALGAAVAARLVPALRRPLRVYAWLELGIGLAALAVPMAIAACTDLYVALFSGDGALAGAGGASRATFRFVSSLGILLVPTGLMGATLPLLAAHVVRHDEEIGTRVGGLYAINTAGAVLGAVLAGFALLPSLGVSRTVWTGAAMNFAIFALAALLARNAPERVVAKPTLREGSTDRSGRWVLPWMATSGVISFGYEVLWSRLLGHVLGGSLYGFATMLASFLLGISLGSALASRFATRSQRSMVGLGWAQLGAAGLSLSAFALLDPLSGWFRAIAFGPGDSPGLAACVAAAVLLPSALCIGATFPLAVRVLAERASDAGPASARVYAWNTAGSIVGALATGFVLLPVMGFSGWITGAACMHVALALLVAGPLARSRSLLVASAVVVVAYSVLLPPKPPLRLLRASPLRAAGPSGEIVHLGVGRSATVLLTKAPGAWRLGSNGLPESRIRPRGASAGVPGLDRWLAGVASLVRPEARRMLVVGLGGGVALEGVPSSIHSIDVVELEPEIVEANRQVATQRRRDPLSDPRVRVSLDDARSALLLAAEDYDAIVSQPSHPWTSGSSHLFTREFFELARARLTADGVFVQWMGLRFVDAALLRTLVATLADVFEFVNVYQPIPGGVVLLGSDEPLGLGVESIAAIAADPDAFAQLGVFRTEDGVASLVLDAAGARAFAADAEINRDDRNWLQMRSLAVARGEREPRPAAAWSELDALLRLQAADFDLAAVVRRLLARGFEARARRVAEAIDDPAQRYAAEAWIALRSGRPVATRRALEASLSIDPGGAEARAAWLNLATRSRFAVDGAALAAPFVPTAADSALFDGWMAAHRRTWQPVRDIDAELAAVSPADPRFGLAARLRVAWRLASDAPGSAREAVPIAESLVPWSGAAGDLLLRARALAASGDEDAALATLFQVAERLTRAPRRPDIATREALQGARELSSTLPVTAERSTLQRMLNRARYSRPLERR